MGLLSKKTNMEITNYKSQIAVAIYTEDIDSFFGHTCDMLKNKRESHRRLSHFYVALSFFGINRCSLHYEFRSALRDFRVESARPG